MAAARGSQTARIPAAYRGAAERAPRRVQGGSYVADLSTDAGSGRADQPGSDSVVVFLIGMRVNRWRRVRTWWPVFASMPKMLRELQARPDAGLLDARSFWSGRTFLTVQYWSSMEALGRFARDPRMTHQPAWAAFNRSGAGTGDVGVFHETYEVPRSAVESLYGNMPPFGLGRALGTVSRSAGRRTRAQDAMGQRDPEYVEAS